MRLTLAVALALAAALPTRSPAESPAELRARGDALRKAGDPDGAVRAFEAALAGGDRSSEAWKRLGWAEKARRRFAAAEAALEKAVAADPSDREARDDLADLRRSRGLRVSGWRGGTEPGTSATAYELQAWYGGLDRVELSAGGSWTDNVFYEATKGFASAYWFYAPDSYVKADFTLRKYGYSGANRPTPDSNAYELVPRGEVEISHWFAGRVRGAVAYQLHAPNFFYDQGKRFLNHKLSGEVEVRIGGGLSATLLGALLRDPDPRRTDILGRPLPDLSTGAGVDCTPPGAPLPVLCATASRVVYRDELLVGGGLWYEAERWGAGVKYIPNRDLDSGFAWSVITSAELRPTDRLGLSLAWVFDRYETSPRNLAFSGKDGHIGWASARYQITPELAAGGGLKWVRNPSPRSTTTPTDALGIPTETRNDPTLLLHLEYRTGLF